MPEKIKLQIGDIELDGELFDTECADAVKEMLPVKAEFERWGDEIYFDIELEMPLDDTAKIEVPVGTIGYWPTGKAITVFYGPTPASVSDKPAAISEVNVIGELEDAEKISLAEGSSDVTLRIAHRG